MDAIRVSTLNAAAGDAGVTRLNAEEYVISSRDLTRAGIVLTSSLRLIASESWLAARQAREAQLTVSRDAWKNEVDVLNLPALSTAMSRLNAFCLISALPDDVLARIFEHLVYIYPINASEQQWGWACVTQVSRRFRIAAIDHALLWSKLSIDGHTPWNIFLSRARGALLHVHGEPATKEQSAYYATRTLQNIERVCAINVVEIMAGTGWHQVLHTAAPELHTLNLAMEVFGEDDSGGTMDPRTLTRDFPNLRKIRLCGIQMFWKLDAPIMLRSLAVIFATIDPAQFSVSNVLQCLQNMPFLQDLVLDSVLPPSSGCGINMRVSMPHLRFLSLTEPDKRCMDLWANLNAPHSCSIHIKAQQLDIDGAATWRAIFLDQLAKREHPAYRRVRFEDPRHDGWLTRGGIRFSLLSTATDEDTKPAAARSPQTSSYIDADIPSSFAFSFVGPAEPFCNHFGLPYVGSNQPVVRDEEWKFAGALLVMRCVNSLLSRLTTLETAEVCRSSERIYAGYHKLEHLLHACFLEELSHPSDTNVPHVLPNARTWILRNAHLEHRITNDQGNKLHEVLSEVFRRRHFAHMPIRIVHLSETRVNISWLQAWKNYVDEVHCDATCRRVRYSVEDSDSESLSDDSIFRSGLR